MGSDVHHDGNVQIFAQRSESRAVGTRSIGSGVHAWASTRTRNAAAKPSRGPTTLSPRPLETALVGVTPNARSKSDRRALTTDFETPTFRAAAAKEPASAIESNVTTDSRFSIVRRFWNQNCQIMAANELPRKRTLKEHFTRRLQETSHDRGKIRCIDMH